MILPTRRALLLVACGWPLAAVPALAGEATWPVWVAAASAVLALIGLDAILAVPARLVSADVRSPNVLYVGDEDPLAVTLRAPRRLRAIDVLPETSGVLTPPALARAALAGGEGALEFALRPARRGRAQLDALWLRWRGPLGLTSRSVRLPAGCTLHAVPDVRAVKRHALRFSRRDAVAGVKIEQYLGDGSEFESLREYVPGFDRRAVDWKASARHRRLLVRQHRAERNHRIELAIDAGRLMGEPIAGIPRLDHAVNAALHLAYVALRTGDLVGVHVFDDAPRIQREAAAGLKALQGVQHALAAVEYSSAETNYALALTALLQRVRRRSLVVLFTDFVDATTAELMVPALRRAAKRHLVLFAAIRDPEPARLADLPPPDGAALHRAVVAADLVREREVVLERVRRAGVQVVDAPVAELGPRLIDRYLELVRREAV